ncbi:MAG: hypothetical protein M1344_04690 [Candidatus Thermoplasmatota archaeon]|nr:hypothetical protein [Candidatus Thermoplasmatota archaeon]
MIVLLVFLTISATADVLRRKVETVFYLGMDTVLLFFFIYFNWMLVFFMIPIMCEYFLKGRESFIPYALILLPMLHEMMIGQFNPSFIWYASAIGAVKGGFTWGHFGSGDIKIMETTIMVLPGYFILPFLRIAVPGGLMVILISALASTLATYALRAIPGRPTGWPLKVPANMIGEKDRYKYRMRGEIASYQGPFVFYVAIGYAILLTMMFL